MKICSLISYSKYDNVSKKQTIVLPTFKQPSFKSINTYLSLDMYNKVETLSTRESFLNKYKGYFKNFTKENLDALYRIINNYNLIFSVNDLIQFMDDNICPDFVKLEELGKRVLNEDVFNLYIEPLMKIGKNEENLNTDFEIINNFLDFRLKAIESKELLNKHSEIAKNQDVDDIVLRKIPAVNKTLELIGQDAFIFSFKEKKDNVLAFINDLGNKEWDVNIYQRLMQLTNPTKTPRYKFLEEEIKRLKKLYPQIKDTENVKELQKSINTLTSEKRGMLEKSIKDPKEILEKSLIVAALNNSGLKHEALELLRILNSKTIEEKREYDRQLNEILYKYYEIDIPNEKILDKLNFKNNRYLPRLFYTKQDFKEKFKELIQLLKEAPNEANVDIFNKLSKNVQTRLDFENLGLDYDKWICYNPESKIECKLDANNVVIAQKVDMNNISKALFLGDEAECCTRVNGLFARSAVDYITSKMIQAIEVYHNKIPIANTMCYLAKIGGNPVLILDNIEVKKQYQKDDTVRNAIFDYAKKLVEEIGCPNMPVMLGNRRADVKTADLQSYYYDIEIIGNTGKDKIYLDYKTKSTVVNNSTSCINSIELVPITKNAPIGKQIKIKENGNIIYRAGALNDLSIYTDVNSVLVENNLSQYIDSHTGFFIRDYDSSYD